MPDFRIDHLDRLVDAVVTHVLSPALSVPLTVVPQLDEPVVLRRSDGTSVYEIAGSARYSSPAIFDAEHAVLAHASRYDGRRVDPTSVSLALLETAANGLTLGDDQAVLVHDLATSGARVQLALAPAGTGKTVAMRALAQAWTAGGGTVIGLAPSAGAAQILRTELADHALASDTLAKLVDALTTGRAAPNWATTIGPETLVIIDEAGMAGTLHLATAVDFIIARGGSVRLVGDNQQLAAIGAGGLLRDIERTYGAATLDIVRRFTHPDGRTSHAEAAASLALRDGDPTALAFYTDHDRIHVGDATTTSEQAYLAWTADRAAGLNSILLAPTRDQVRNLNERARTDRLATSPTRAGHEVGLADGTSAGIGDIIVTRHNDRRLATSATDWVTNGDRWTITGVHPDGAITVSHTSARRRVTLPAAYVAEHVQLGYAATVHAAQGMTADTAHAVATGGENRGVLYVALTRGRQANHLYLDVSTGTEPDDITRADAVHPHTAVEVLTRILVAEDSNTSATTERHTANDPALLLGKQVAQYLDALDVAANAVLGPENLIRLTTRAEQIIPGITGHEAWPALRTRLVMIGLDGADPYRALDHALVHARNRDNLDGAVDPAAVLTWRLQFEVRHDHGTVPALPAVPRSVEADDQWGRYFRRRHDLIDEHAGTLRSQVTEWTPTTTPTWAAPLIERDRDLTADLAVWRAGHNIPDTDLRPSGTRRTDFAGTQAQQDLDQRVDSLLGSTAAPAAHWHDWATMICDHLTTDPAWPTTAAALDAAEQGGLTRYAIHTIATTPALPDEQPAAALRWRITAATTDHRDTAPTTTGRPDQRPPPETPLPTPPLEAVNYARAFGNRPNTRPSRGR